MQGIRGGHIYQNKVLTELRLSGSMVSERLQQHPAH